MTLEALGALATVSVAFLNHFDCSTDVHARNRAWLEDRLGVAVFTTPDGLAARLLVRGGRGAP
jgi:hypothetical protein